MRRLLSAMALAGMLGCGEDSKPVDHKSEDTANYNVVREFTQGQGKIAFRFTEESKRHFDDLVYFSGVVGKPVGQNDADLARLLYTLDRNYDRNIGPSEIWPLMHCWDNEHLGNTELKKLCPSYKTGAEEKKADCACAPVKKQ